MKTRLSLLTLCAVTLTCLISCGGGDGDIRLAFVTNGVDPFWKLAEAGARKAGKDLGVDVDIRMPAGGIGEQKQILEDLMTRGVDGVAVSPIDPVNQTGLLNEVAARMNLITHDSDAPDSNRLAYVGMDNYTAGRLCGKLVKEALPDGGSIMILVGRMEQDNAKRRRQGVIDEVLGRSEDPSRFDAPGKVLEGGGYKILGTLTDQFDRAVAKANAEDSLSRYPDLSCFVGLFAYNPPSALQALKQAGKAGKVKIVAFDEHNETLQAIKDGTIYGTVVQNPYMYGYKSIEILTQLKRGDESGIPEGKVIEFAARQIKPDNVDEFWADLKAKAGG